MEKTHGVTHRVELGRNCKAFPGLPLWKWGPSPLFLPEMQWSSTELQLGSQSAGSDRADCENVHPLYALLSIQDLSNANADLVYQL